MNTATRPRFLWQQHIGEPAVPYDGFPFISQREYAEYSCVFMTKSSKNRGKNDNDSFVYMTAGGCNAKNFVRRILRFPSHRIAMLLLIMELQQFVDPGNRYWKIWYSKFLMVWFTLWNGIVSHSLHHWHTVVT